jgi:hypothetical protein
MIRTLLQFSLLSLAIGCGSGLDTISAEGTKPSEAPSDKPRDTKFDKATLAAEAIQVALVPSPAEMQRALGNAGLTTKLSELISARDVLMTSDHKDQIAVRTGVVMADLVLSVQTAEPAAQVTRLSRMKQGFVAMGAEASVVQTIDELSARIASGSGSRDDLVKEFDELSGVMIPKLKFSAGEDMVPLIQAGAWLEGAHLVSGAILAEGKHEEASRLLRQPAVVSYFLGYVRSDGKTRAPDVVVTQLESTLVTLMEIAIKDDLTEADVKTIHSATGAVLNLL